jgi:hypothetical protein
LLAAPPLDNQLMKYLRAFKNFFLLTRMAIVNSR